MDTADDMWIDVTEADIRNARDQWREARDRREPPARLQVLRDRLELFWRVEARQTARHFNAQRYLS